jgi:hypothetical protein
MLAVAGSVLGAVTRDHRMRGDLRVKSPASPADDGVMLSAARLLDRGRLVLGLVLVIPFGAVIGMPSDRAKGGTPAQWRVDQTAAGLPAVNASGSTATPHEVLQRLSGGTATQGNVGQDFSGDDEFHDGYVEVTTPLPATYIQGTSPDADLAAVLRQSQARNSPVPPPPAGNTAATALTANPNIVFTRQSQRDDLASGALDPRLVDLLTWIASRRRITITSMKTDHSQFVAGTNRVSAHKLGRAVDIAVVNGQSCTGVAYGECGRLYEEIVNQLRGTQFQPSQVIYGYDPWPSERWNFAMSNHRDHIHIGY